MTETKDDDVLGQLAGTVYWSSDAVICTDGVGTILSWNRGAETIFGYSTAEAIGENISFLMPPDSPVDSPLHKLVERGERVNYHETVRKRKDGSLVDISISLSPIYGEGGELIGVSGIGRNISGLKQREAAKREVAKLTRREREVLNQIANGLTNKEIAETMGLSIKTAENHRASIMKKLGVQNLAELLRNVFPTLAH